MGVFKGLIFSGANWLLVSGSVYQPWDSSPTQRHCETFTAAQNTGTGAQNQKRIVELLEASWWTQLEAKVWLSVKCLTHFVGIKISRQINVFFVEGFPEKRKNNIVWVGVV